VLKADVKLETGSELRCAHGMCPPPTPLSWREVWETISQKDPVYGVPNRWGYQKTVKHRYRWVSLLLTLPWKWKQKVHDMYTADKLGSIMADEIRKEIDAELIAKISALAKQSNE